jgi:hypothetical protein
MGSLIVRYFVEDLECFVSFCELIGFKVDRTGINGDLGCGLSIPGLDHGSVMVKSDGSALVATLAMKTPAAARQRQQRQKTSNIRTIAMIGMDLLEFMNPRTFW